ncbi:MAG: sigma-70 family RNA polymerase sigma factor [Chloroflexi bacterium]|nr:sigma-70 family RNA polymerase sigma factor [Chloroflexota bacterium]
MKRAEDVKPAGTAADSDAEIRDFSDVVEKYGDFVYNVALRMTGDPHEAEDAMQDAFISAYRAFERFRGESSITTWLYRITVNAVLMKRRKEKKARAVTQIGFDGRDPADWREGPEQAALGAELKETIQRGLQQLPKDLRMAVILRDIQGLSGIEAAEALNVQVSTLKTRLHRGRVVLREFLSQYMKSE